MLMHGQRRPRVRSALIELVIRVLAISRGGEQLWNRFQSKIGHIGLEKDAFIACTEIPYRLLAKIKQL